MSDSINTKKSSNLNSVDGVGAENLWPKLRLMKLFILLLVPILGIIYAYQFTGVVRDTVTPFRSFKVDAFQAFDQGQRKAENLFSQQLTAPISLVNFWASWCAPCVEEFPAMLELERQLESKGFRIVFVSVDEKWEDVENFLKLQKLDVKAENMYWDPKKERAKDWGSEKFPESYVVRQDGWVVEKIVGLQQWTRPAVLKYFESLIEEAPKLNQASLSFPNFLVHLPFQGFLKVVGGFMPLVQAQDSGAVLHEDDKKTLQKLKQNIETASKNLRQGEAQLLEEKRNLEELQATLARRKDADLKAQSDLRKLRSSYGEIQRSQDRTQLQKNREQTAKEASERSLKEAQSEVLKLEKDLARAREKLVEAQQNLSTRAQAVETSLEAVNSATEQESEAKKQLEAAESAVKKEAEGLVAVQGQVKEREAKIRELDAQIRKLRGALDEQTQTLNKFEKILQE